MLLWLVPSGRNTAVLILCLVLNMVLRMVKLYFTDGADLYGGSAVEEEGYGFQVLRIL